MNKETFAKYISNPSLLDNDTLPEIKAMLDEFPYFQSAWVLYIKNLHAIKDIRYESKLKTACAYISDRKHLHDILKGAYIPAIAPVQTQFIASPIEENPEEIAIVQPQNLVAQNESEANTTENVQTQFIASQEEEEETIPQQEEILKDSTIVQTQNLASQPEEIAENTTSVQAQFIASQPEKEIADTEIQQSSTSTTPSEQDITQDITIEAEANADDNVQTQGLASQEEAIVQPQNIVAQQEEIHEDTTQFIASQEETPASPEPDKPESLADRILRQVEEMRRAKAAAAYTENQNSESPVETQCIASQPKEIPDTTIVQTQDLASQQDENAENPAIVQAQFIASQPEEDPEEIATVQPQNIEAQPEDITEDIPIVQTQFIASQPEEEAEEIATVQPQNIVAQAESEANTTENVQTQNFASLEITPAQIKALLEKQLHDIGINANITFTGNSANIQFENIATDEKPEENKPEQPIAEDESSTEITTAPIIEEQIEKRKNDRDKKANLIDKFIESKAKIVPKKDYHSDNKLSTESIIEDEELFTEQLAKIYIKQGHLEKALETYEKLYLKYPEKNIYFATRIEYVKRLMNK
ncbi:MAG: hypothetical protein IKO34_01825 [Bacteroidales bacterium]|nr:hypothetical protein [Bacteroidales bacterium]